MLSKRLNNHKRKDLLRIFLFSVTWRLIELCRQLVDSKKDDGFSSLHLGKI